MVEDSKVGNGRTRGQKTKAKKMSHPQPLKVEENRREDELPFGWRKIAYKGSDGLWTTSILSPNEGLMVEDLKVGNAGLPPKALSEQAEATESFRNVEICQKTEATKMEKNLNPKARPFLPRSMA